MESTTAAHYGEAIFAPRNNEAERIRALAAATDPGAQACLSRIPVPRGGRFLEVGPGLGTMVPWFLTTYHPSEMVLLDRDVTLLEPLASPNVTVLTADINDPDITIGEFDLIFVKSVLMHLPDREAITARLASWLRPGGWLVVIDGCDLSAAGPESPLRSAMTAQWLVLGRTIGATSEWAMSFPEPLRRAGLTDLGVAAEMAVAEAGAPYTRFLQLTFESLRPKMLETRAVTADELDFAIEQLAGPRPPALGTLGVVTTWGRKAL